MRANYQKLEGGSRLLDFIGFVHGAFQSPLDGAWEKFISEKSREPRKYVKNLRCEKEFMKFLDAGVVTYTGEFVLAPDALKFFEGEKANFNAAVTYDTIQPVRMKPTKKSAARQKKEAASNG